MKSTTARVTGIALTAVPTAHCDAQTDSFRIIPWLEESPCPHAQVKELHPYPYPYPYTCPHPHPHRLYPCLCSLFHPSPSWADLVGAGDLDPCLLMGVPQRLTPLCLAHCNHMQALVASTHPHPGGCINTPTPWRLHAQVCLQAEHVYIKLSIDAIRCRCYVACKLHSIHLSQNLVQMAIIWAEPDAL